MRPPHVDRRCHIQAPRLLLCLYFLSVLSTQGTTWIWILSYLANTLNLLAFGHHHHYHQLRRLRSRLRQHGRVNVGGTEKIRKIEKRVAPGRLPQRICMVFMLMHCLKNCRIECQVRNRFMCKTIWIVKPSPMLNFIGTASTAPASLRRWAHN